jgi:hypothetical protein
MELWTLADQQRIKPISHNLTHIFEELQRETEENDVLLMLGVELYSEIQNNIEAFSILLNGGTFDENGVIISFRGLKYVCCYLLYANYIKVSSIQDTFSGFMQNAPEGQARVSASALNSIASGCAQVAGTQYDLCKRYLNISQVSKYFPVKANKSYRINVL